MMVKKLRILYAAGPGNVIGTYKYWKQGKDDPSQVALTYSGQFYDVSKELNAKAYVIASCEKPGFLKEGLFKIEHRPILFQNLKSPILYHLGQIYYGLRLLISAIRFNANVAVVSTGTHWFMLSFMSLFGIKVIPTLHCVLWPKYKKLSKIRRLINKLDKRFFSKRAFTIMSLSNDITNQINKLTQQKYNPIIAFLPIYKKIFFLDIQKPDINKKPFKVFFAGRIEKNKGIFYLLDIAKYFKEKGIKNIVFDICGDGSILKSLKEQVIKLGLEHIFFCYGYCKRPEMKDKLSKAHVLIVPTTTDFIEGFNKVVVEGILSGRPVITSSVCPALDYVRDAIAEVAPNDAKGYRDMILKLYKDKKFYEKKRKACLKYQEQFYEKKRGWGTALKRILMDIRRNKISKTQERF